ncbi:MAG: ABC transporter permease [Planctomycetota bacterium]
MLGFVARRLAIALPLALGAATVVFALMETAPGSATDVLLGDRPVPPDVRQRIEQVYGLDRPPAERYLRWLSALFLQGELGWSHSRSRPVATAIKEALPATVTLAGSALLLHLVSGILLGALSAAWRGKWTDKPLTLAVLVLYAMPAFWLGLMSILLLSYYIPLLPASSLESVGAEEWSWARRLTDRLWHLILPASVLGLASTAATMRLVRAGLLRSLGSDFLRAARARGLGLKRVLFTHALRNALVPVVNYVGVSLPVLLSGSLVIEVVFAWPGMGRLTYDAILAQDHSVVLATTLLATMMVVAGNLAADLAMAAVDPRIRLTGPRGRP